MKADLTEEMAEMARMLRATLKRPLANCQTALEARDFDAATAALGDAVTRLNKIEKSITKPKLPKA